MFFIHFFQIFPIYPFQNPFNQLLPFILMYWLGQKHGCSCPVYVQTFHKDKALRSKQVNFGSSVVVCSSKVLYRNGFAVHKLNTNVTVIKKRTNFAILFLKQMGKFKNFEIYQCSEAAFYRCGSGINWNNTCVPTVGRRFAEQIWGDDDSSRLYPFWNVFYGLLLFRTIRCCMKIGKTSYV